MRVIVFLSLFFSAYAFAVVETYDFDNEVLQERYTSFIDELRCPKCQNQNLSGSNSPIAADLRRELHRLLHEGKSDTEIVGFMVDRYGEFVLYRPPLNAETVVLWFAPVIFLFIGGVIVFYIVKRQKLVVDDASTEVLEDEVLQEEEQEKLKQLLNKDGLVKEDLVKDDSVKVDSNA